MGKLYFWCTKSYPVAFILLVCVVYVLYQIIGDNSSPTMIRISPNKGLKTTPGRFPGNSEMFKPKRLSEAVALRFEPCTDHKQAADPNMSNVMFEDVANKTYQIGDEIRILVILKNGYGQRRTSGGDVVRARMFTSDKKAFAPGVVVDNNDGSYTVVFEATWSGNSTVIVTLAYTREEITSMYRMRNQTTGTVQIVAKFTNGKYSEETFCHVFPEQLPQYTEVCNFTHMVDGMQWICGKPREVHLLCEDWTHYRMNKPLPKLPITGPDTILLKRSWTNRDIPHQLKLVVNGEKNEHTIKTHPPSTPCYKYNTTKLWSRGHITGYSLLGKWFLRHCKVADSINVSSCFLNRKLLLLGDSTIRYWYVEIMKRLDCKQITEPWKTKTWHKRAACVNEKINFTAEWLLQSQPFCNPTFESNRYTLFSISRHIDAIQSSTYVVVVVHLYLHLVPFHHSVFRAKIKQIRNSIQNLLERNKMARVLIKGPHTCSDFGGYLDNTRMSDFYADIYTDILFEEFKGLHDRVVYLEQADMTLAMNNKNFHPTSDIVKAMVGQLLAYVCV